MGKEKKKNLQARIRSVKKRVRDELTQLGGRFAAWGKPWLVRKKNMGLLWHPWLYMQGAKRQLDVALGKTSQRKEIADMFDEAKRLEEEIKRLQKSENKQRSREIQTLRMKAKSLRAEAQELVDAVNRQEEMENAAADEEAKLREQELWDAARLRLHAAENGLLRLGEAAGRVRFCASLFFALLSMLGALLPGHAAAGACAAAFMLIWLGNALMLGYAPVAAGVRQRYVAAMLLRAMGLAVLLLKIFQLYVAGGVVINIVLQSAMVVVLPLHVLLFAIGAAINREQPLSLRLLYGVLGMIPALMFAAAIALMASRMVVTPAGALLVLLGTGAYFVGEELSMMLLLDGGRAGYGWAVVSLTSLVGGACMTAGCWMI